MGTKLRGSFPISASELVPKLPDIIALMEIMQKDKLWISALRREAVVVEIFVTSCSCVLRRSRGVFERYRKFLHLFSPAETDLIRPDNEIFKIEAPHQEDQRLIASEFEDAVSSHTAGCSHSDEALRRSKR